MEIEREADKGHDRRADVGTESNSGRSVDRVRVTTGTQSRGDMRMSSFRCFTNRRARLMQGLNGV